MTRLGTPISDISALPSELLLRILAFLDPQSLEAVSSTCRRLHILVDASAYRSAFRQAYGDMRYFSAVGRTWQVEFSKRWSVLRRFQRARGYNISFDGKIGNITHTFQDYASHVVLLCNSGNGLASFAYCNTGKVAKDLLFPSNFRQISMDVTAMAGFKHGVVYGYLNGLIAINLITNGSKLRTDFHSFVPQHNGIVTTLATSNMSPNGLPTIVSGDSLGFLNIWDHRRLQPLVAQISVSEQPLRNLYLDTHRNRVIVLSAAKEVFIIDLERLNLPRQASCVYKDLESLEFLEEIICDTKKNVVVLFTDTLLVHINFSNDCDPIIRCFCPLKVGAIKYVAACAEEGRTEEPCPGEGGRSFGFITDEGYVSIMEISTLSPICNFSVSQPCNASSMAMNAYVVAIGFEDGSVSLYDILQGRELRPLCSRIPKYQRIAHSDLTRTKVAHINLHPTLAAGIIIIGGQVNSFDFEPPSFVANGKRRGLSRKRQAHGSSSFSVGGLQEHIKEGLDEMEEKKLSLAEAVNRARKYDGELMLEMTDSELMSYARMLSLESSAELLEHSDSSTLVQGHEIALSHAPESIQPVGHTSQFDSERPEEQGVFDEDLALALALSRSMS